MAKPDHLEFATAAWASSHSG